MQAYYYKAMLPQEQQVITEHQTYSETDDN